MTSAASLIARRLLHDLAGPLSAIVTAADLLDGDEEIRTLIVDSAAALAASLRLHRFVLAPATNPDAGDEAQTLLAAWVATREAMTLDWAVAATPLDAARAAVMLGLAMCAIEAAPGGGTLRIADDAVTLRGRTRLDADVEAGLRGRPTSSSKAALAVLVAAAAADLGHEVGIDADAGALHLSARRPSPR